MLRPYTFWAHSGLSLYCPYILNCLSSPEPSGPNISAGPTLLWSLLHFVLTEEYPSVNIQPKVKLYLNPTLTLVILYFCISDTLAYDLFLIKHNNFCIHPGLHLVPLFGRNNNSLQTYQTCPENTNCQDSYFLYLPLSKSVKKVFTFCFPLLFP